jgi:hypothetical protein
MTRYDTCLPIGGDCTPAHYLQILGLRTEAYPLDWMIFSANTFIHLFQTGFSDFFSSIIEEESIEANPCRYIRDTANNILSIHHFPKDREIADVIDGFHSKMRRRYLRLHDRLTRSGSLLMLGYRQDTEEQVENTLLAFAAIYPHLSIHLINVHHMPDMDSDRLRRERHVLNARLAATCCYFNGRYDTHAQRSFGLWGNEALWRRVLAERE